MDTHNNTIAEFLSSSKTVFVVPVYQRNYDWNEHNCKQLFKDIEGCIRTQRHHFLGTIFFRASTSHEKEIIDGQQRLTSITLLLKALYDITENKDIRDEIKNEYLINKGHSIDTEYLKIKLHLNKRDDEIYKILLKYPPNILPDYLTITQKNSHLFQNYLLFTELLRKYIDRGGNATDFLDAMEKLTIITLEVQDENPQEIFESLNSTGMDLTNVDLLRNYVFMQFSHQQQTELYDQYWSRIEDAVGVDNMQSFFCDYLAYKKLSDSITINGRKEHINDKNLYIAFKAYYEELMDHAANRFEETVACFKDILRCALLYKNFIFKDKQYPTDSVIQQKLYLMLVAGDVKNVQIVLLYLFSIYSEEKISKEVLGEAIDGLASYAFRAKVCNGGGFTRQFAANVVSRLDAITDFNSFEDGFWKALTFGRGRYTFPSDSEFYNELRVKDLYNTLRSKGCKYMLYRLENHSPFQKEIRPFDADSISVDHIMPQTPSSEWKSYLKQDDLIQYDSHLHCLGNLTLTNYNAEMSNKSFEEKQEIYKNSGFYYSRKLAECDHWSCDEIEKRGKSLAEKALQIWRMPEAYQKDNNDRRVLHSLQEDTDAFAYTKPVKIFIDGEELNVQHWNDFLPTLCHWINEDNEDTLKIIAEKDTHDFKIEDDAAFQYSQSYKHVKDNIYVYATRSSQDLLEGAKRIVRVYDDLNGTDVTDTLRFTIKK